MKNKQVILAQVEKYCTDRWIVTVPSIHPALAHEDKFRTFDRLFKSEQDAVEYAAKLRGK